MLGGLSIGPTASGPPTRRISIVSRIELNGSSLKIRLERIRSGSSDEVSLGALEVDGQSVLDQIADAVSPQLAATPAPGRVTGQGRVVTALTEALEVGALYLVSYEILADGGTSALYFPDGGGSPFSNANVAPFTVGRHKLLIEAKDTDFSALMRIRGDLTFGHVSCRKAEWRYDLPQGTVYPELIERLDPGRIQGTDAVVSTFATPLEPNAAHTLKYHIAAATHGAELSIATGAGSPPERTRLPASTGHHTVTVTADAGSAADALLASGDLTFGYASCRRAGGIAGRQIAATVQAGSARTGEVIFTPDPGRYFVAPWGDDRTGTGALNTPFATPEQALTVAEPGDTIILRPGTYAPFHVTQSGANSQPLTITTLPGEERLAIVEGDLMQHASWGGPGIARNMATRDGIYILGRDHVHIRNLTIRNVWRAGVFIVGIAGETHGQHVLAGNLVQRTGASGIYVGGRAANQVVPLDTIDTIETDGVLIEHNDVSETNVVTDYNGGVSNSQGEPGGVVEAISVAALAGNIVTRFNDVHDTRQYGIDYKAGVRGGAIYGNRVWNVVRYGIYLDAGRRFIEDIAIYDNRVWNCRMGIVLAREAGSNTIEYGTYRDQIGAAEFVQKLDRIDIYNNVVWNIRKAGIFCQRHGQKDGPDGVIRDVRIRFNTVYNANRDLTARDLNLSGWSASDFMDAGVTSGVDFIGNIVWNDTDNVSVLNEFTGQTGFDVSANLIGIDPDFTDPSADPPDLSLSVASAGIGLADTASVAAPFGRDIDGKVRDTSRAAGAFATN